MAASVGEKRPLEAATSSPAKRHCHRLTPIQKIVLYFNPLAGKNRDPLSLQRHFNHTGRAILDEVESVEVLNDEVFTKTYEHSEWKNDTLRAIWRLWYASHISEKDAETIDLPFESCVRDSSIAYDTPIMVPEGETEGSHLNFREGTHSKLDRLCLLFRLNWEDAFQNHLSYMGSSQNNKVWEDLFIGTLERGWAYSVATFLENGFIDPSLLDDEGNTILHKYVCSQSCLQSPNFISTLELLLEYLNIDVQNNLGQTPLHLATRNGDCELVEALLKKKACPDVKDNEGLLPISYSDNDKIKELFNT